MTHEPPISLVTGAFSKLRTQIQKIAKSIAGLSEEKRIRWPADLNPYLSGLAYGSLVVGMRVPRPDDVGTQGQLVLEGVTDGLYEAVREAVCSLPLCAQADRPFVITFPAHGPRAAAAAAHCS